MAESSESPKDRPSEISELPDMSQNSVSDFDPCTMRKTKPGLKRLFLTLTVLFSFLLGSPFLLKSIEIYRSPLPFRDIQSLSDSVGSSPLLFPCHFQAIFVGFDNFDAYELGFSIKHEMRKLTKHPVCGTCSNTNYTVSVTVDSASGCTRNYNAESSCMWRCGGIGEFDFGGGGGGADDGVDEFLGSVLGSCEGFRKVYSVVVVNRGGEVRAVVGKYRHAWIVGGVLEEGMDAVVARVAETFVKVFVNGGKEEGSIHGEFMPVGADGRIVLSFNLLNADPTDWIYGWYGALFSSLYSSEAHFFLIRLSNAHLYA